MLDPDVVRDGGEGGRSRCGNPNSITNRGVYINGASIPTTDR